MLMFSLLVTMTRRSTLLSDAHVICRVSAPCEAGWESVVGNGAILEDAALARDLFQENDDEALLEKERPWLYDSRAKLEAMGKKCAPHPPAIDPAPGP